MGQAMASSYGQVTVEVYEGRWGHVFDSCRQIVQNERMLRWGWEKSKYVGEPKKSRDSDIDAVDTAMQSEEFWSTMKALSLRGVIIDVAMEWTGGCPCHSCWETPDVDPKLRVLWRKCLVRGMRLAVLFLRYTRRYIPGIPVCIPEDNLC